MSDTNPHIERAIHISGSQAALAAAVGCSQQNISILARGGKISAEIAVAIERATDGVVARQHLRPDLFGAPVAGTTQTHQEAG